MEINPNAHIETQSKVIWQGELIMAQVSTTEELNWVNPLKSQSVQFAVPLSRKKGVYENSLTHIWKFLGSTTNEKMPAENLW